MGGQAGPTARRAFYVSLVNEGLDAEGNVHEFEDLSKAEEWLGKILTTLVTVGGTVVIQADRVKTGMLGDEPLAQTAGLVAQWSSQTGKLREGSATPSQIEEPPAAAEEE